MKNKKALKNVSWAALLVTSLVAMPLSLDAACATKKDASSCQEGARGALPCKTKEQNAQNLKMRKLQARKAQKMQKNDNALVAKCIPTTVGYSKSSIHTVHSLSPNGDTIEIENGAVFTIRDWDSSTVKKWGKNTPIRLTCNTWGSYKYEFKVVNDITGDTAQANISLAPFVLSPNTRRISKITGNGIVILDNGAYYQVSDTSVISGWQDSTMTPGYAGDMILVGDNDGFMTWGYNNVLFNLNVATSTQVTASRIP